VTIPARELHRQDMAASRSYRWRYRLHWLPSTAKLAWLRLMASLAR
jgi:hypothetical protein